MHILRISLLVLAGLSFAFAIQSLRLRRQIEQSEMGLMAASERRQKYHRRFCLAMAVTMVILATNSLAAVVFGPHGFLFGHAAGY